MRADARRNRELILAAAAAAFEADGLGVPVDDIARRAGVGAGTLYRHFPTKEALFEAVLVDHLLQLADEAAALVDHDHPGDALFDFLNALSLQATSKRNLVDALSVAGIDLHQSEADPKGRVDAAVGALLGRAQAAGEIRSDITLADLYGLVMGACGFAGENADCSPTRMLSVVFDGLRAPAESPPS